MRGCLYVIFFFTNEREGVIWGIFRGCKSFIIWMFDQSFLGCILIKEMSQFGKICLISNFLCVIVSKISHKKGADFNIFFFIQNFWTFFIYSRFFCNCFIRNILKFSEIINIAISHWLNMKTFTQINIKNYFQIQYEEIIY